MKKLLLVLAIGAFVACNESGSEESTTADTSATSTLDTNTTAPAVTDTLTAAPADSSAVKVDTAAAK